MGGENDGFSLFCFFVGVKIKLKDMLFHNLYEDILVHQELNTKQRNPLVKKTLIFQSKY